MHIGQGAQTKIGAPGLNIGNPNNPRYPRVFIQSLSLGYSVFVRRGTSVIYMVWHVINNIMTLCMFCGLLYHHVLASCIFVVITSAVPYLVCEVWLIRCTVDKRYELDDYCGAI